MEDDVTRPHKFVDSVPKPAPGVDLPAQDAMPDETPATSAEQRREAEASRNAHNAQGHLRDRLVEDGKAHHMGGRGTGRVSDRGS